jgi:uncharacterized protein (DUF1684 family)
MHDHDHEHDHDQHHEHEHEHTHEHAHADEHGHEDMDPHEHELVHFRMAKDHWFATDPHSPLPHELAHDFLGLAYYPWNSEMRMQLKLDRNVSDEPIEVQTSTGDVRVVHRAGKIRFEINGEAAELTVLTSPDGELFLPMRDATSGKESYGAGRYLEPEKVGDDEIAVDFNYLYSPYCAYDERYSCPLPPMENWIKVPIEAGEKNFEKS